ncbi:hypothetical protein CONCODRAFT_5547 [Conidiobolus coronatus NRRL 28638]|uniref:Bulb-type lectin domain-containing protein n=1 Tax=Conidiobolus coronatus (strain ATCC 28846 / CBS 209.66 / NRRL 28638) TaxID=796925 RepID=A0A137P9Z8_CONC2|nr:hypothetical protein CONCODRAFT_5547 [Conidiobolus coronatus NRRL 28638]|eukprot:KXN71751.1 hypothetical protein CONCODRAFT_5547 [Conidiobolus coronatus NRRL 28638]
MKVTAFLFVLITSTSAEFWIEGTRPDGTFSLAGGTTGCFATYGPFTKVEVSEGTIALFYDDLSCKGKQIWDATEGMHQLPRQINSYLLL